MTSPYYDQASSMHENDSSIYRSLSVVSESGNHPHVSSRDGTTSAPDKEKANQSVDIINIDLNKSTTNAQTKKINLQSKSFKQVSVDLKDQ